MHETPTIGATSYAQALTASNMLNAMGMQEGLGAYDAPAARRITLGAQTIGTPIPTHSSEIKMADFSTRLVKVFIVDPNINLPLDNRLLYRGDEKITDLTDQELFFEVDINSLLSKHNETRLKTEDKKANKDKPVYLEAARVRDLKMQVVVLAQF